MVLKANKHSIYLSIYTYTCHDGFSLWNNLFLFLPPGYTAAAAAAGQLLLPVGHLPAHPPRQERVFKDWF